MRRVAAALVGLLVSLSGMACRGPMAKIEALHDALVADDAGAVREATAGFPMCGDLPPAAVLSLPGKPGPRDGGCLADIANALGSKRGFGQSPPDHAAAATAALVLARDGRGDWFAHADVWLTDLKSGAGTGHDALRLAVARRMAEAAPVVGRKIDDEPSAKAAMRAVVSAVPGACPTYWLLGASADPARIPPELKPDHAACVQKDLARREGPGGRYGAGTFRATEGALALWRETERALRMGLGRAAPGPKAVLEKKLAIIESATRAIETTKMESATPVSVLSYMSDVHAEAGVPIFRPRDAGADGASALDAGAH